jgi:UDPglucose 6-dehydrogenase
MNVSIIGTGYVGLVTGACLAELGMNVTCMDKDENKIANLKSGIMPIYEHGLKELVYKNHIEADRLQFTTSIQDTVSHGDVIVLAVNTPTLPDYSCDLSYLFEAVDQIGRYMDTYTTIVVKSTVPVGTGQSVRDRLHLALSLRKVHCDFDVVSNPEFLRQGSAVYDFLHPDRIVIGCQSIKAAGRMHIIYRDLISRGIPFIVGSIETAEMIKYAANAFLAAKISFINEIANLCELCNADVTVVSKAIGLDSRIGPSFLNAGPGYGGSCFPKDTKALIGLGKALGYAMQLVKSIVAVNSRQRKRMLEKINRLVVNPEGRIITLLGLAFKPETDDIRESPSLWLARRLLRSGALVRVYDPKAMDNAKRILSHKRLEYCSDAYSACEGSDCVVLVTEWEELCSLDLQKLGSMVRTPVFIDLRNVYSPGEVRDAGFEYEGVGRK